METIFGYDIAPELSGNVFFDAYLKSINYPPSTTVAFTDLKFNPETTGNKFRDFVTMPWVGQIELEHTRDQLKADLKETIKSHRETRFFSSPLASFLIAMFVGLPLGFATNNIKGAVGICIGIFAAILFVDFLARESTQNTIAMLHERILEYEYALKLVEFRLMRIQNSL